MSYGPKLTAKQKARLEAEIKAFNKTKVLKEIEENAVGDKDVNAYQNWLDENRGLEPISANPDILSDEDVKPMGPTYTNPEMREAKLEINHILSHRQKQVWNLCMRQGVSAEEAGEQLKISTRTVQSYLKDATQKVKDHFGGRDE